MLLWEGAQLRGAALPNRLVCPPMVTHLGEVGVNEVTDSHLVHYGSIGLGGVGLIIVEATAVEDRGRLFVDDIGLWDDSFIHGHRRLTDHIHSTSTAKIGIQICHAGGKGSTRINANGMPEQLPETHPLGSELVSSSAVPFDPESSLVPRALRIDELAGIRESFVAAAKRAVVAGYDLIEVHGAHGYLLNQFSSAEINKRKDKYGGSTMNRLRFPLEVVSAVRAAIPADMPLSVRISACDWTVGGFTKSDAIVYAAELKARGVDVVHVSTGGVTAKQMIPGGGSTPAYQLPFATAIREEVRVPVITVGNMDDMEMACETVETHKADFVAVGRRLLRDPFWPRKAATELGLEPWIPRHQRPAWGMSARKKAALEAKTREVDLNEQEMPELDGPPANVMCNFGRAGLCGWLASPRA